MKVHWPWQLCYRAVMWPTAFSSLYFSLALSSCFSVQSLESQNSSKCNSIVSSHRMPVSRKHNGWRFPWGDSNPKALDLSPGAEQCSEAQPYWPFECKLPLYSHASLIWPMNCAVFWLWIFLFTYLADCFHVQNKRNIFAISTFVIQVWVLIVTIFYPLLQKNVLSAQRLSIYQVFRQMDPCLPWSLKVYIKCLSQRVKICGFEPALCSCLDFNQALSVSVQTNWSHWSE